MVKKNKEYCYCSFSAKNPKSVSLNGIEKMSAKKSCSDLITRFRKVLAKRPIAL